MRAVLFALLFATACQKTEERKRADVPAPGASVTQKPKTPQVEAPLDIKNPPADAVRTESGLIYKTLTSNPSGQLPKRNDTVMIRYTGWRQESGETFFSNKTSENAMPLNLATTARGFTEGMQLVRKGETAMLWLPPSIGLKQQPQGNAKGETLVYEVEVVDIKEAPAIPPDIAAPPADALVTKKRKVKYVVARPGTGKEKARVFDDLTFHYTAWDGEGRMIETTEMKKQPAKSAPFRQSAAFEDVLTQMAAGERVRFWVDAEQMKPQLASAATGPLVYEVELIQIDKPPGTPPPTPPDVAHAPAGPKSPKGVFYRVLEKGKGGPKPTPKDAVKVNYTGWTTDGRMFDSSTLKNQPAEFSLQGVIAGWTDGIPLMSVGDKYRFWIPEELAYKGQPGKPQGMLVFDVELLEIKPPAKPDMPHGHP